MVRLVDSLDLSTKVELLGIVQVLHSRMIHFRCTKNELSFLHPRVGIRVSQTHMLYEPLAHQFQNETNSTVPWYGSGDSSNPVAGRHGTAIEQQKGKTQEKCTHLSGR